MTVVTGLILFALAGAIVCARARAVGPALFFGVVAVALLPATPLGTALGTFLGGLVDYAQNAAAPGGASGE